MNWQIIIIQILGEQEIIIIIIVVIIVVVIVRDHRTLTIDN